MSSGGPTTQTTTNTPWEPTGDIMQYLYKYAGGTPGTPGKAATEGSWGLQWDPQSESNQPYWIPGTEAVAATPGTPGLLDSPLKYYEGPTVAGFAPEQLQAFGMTKDLATKGNATVNAASKTAQDTLSGKNINPAGALYGGVAGGNTLNTNPLYGLIGNYASGGSLYDNPGYGLYADTAAGKNVYGNPLNTLTGGIASGQELYNNPLFGLTSGVAAGQDLFSNPINQLLGGMASGQNVSNNPGIGYLTGTAEGGFLNNNPYLDQTYNNMAKQVGQSFRDITMPGIGSRFSLAGRTGSGAEQDAYGLAERELGQTLNNLATNVYGQNYATERQNQLGAANTIANLFNQGQGQQLAAAQTLGGAFDTAQAQRLGAASNLGSIFGQGQAQRLAAAQGLGGAYDTAIGQQLNSIGQISDLYGQGQQNQLAAASNLGSVFANEQAQQLQGMQGLANTSQQDMANKLAYSQLAPTFAAQDWMNIGQLGQVGAQQQAQTQAGYNAAQQAYNFNQMAPWQQAQMFAGLLSGGGGGYGTQTQPIYGGGNSLGGAIGGGLGAAGTAGMLGLYATNPWLAGGMVGAGVLGGYLR